MKDLYLVDSHCHLEDEALINNINEIIKKATQNRVKTLVCIGTDINSSLKAVELSNKFENVYAVVGIFPEYSKEYVNRLDEIKKIAQNKKVIAIGEIGFDFHRLSKKDNFESQKKLFEEQIKIADELNLPIVVHSRDAYQETLDLLKIKSPIKSGVFHCFSYSYEFFLEIQKLGFVVGFDGPITFKNASNLREVVSKIPLDSIILETDSPYLAPEPLRGKTNEPANIVYIAQKLSEIKGVSIDEIYQKTSSTFERMFLDGKK